MLRGVRLPASRILGRASVRLSEHDGRYKAWRVLPDRIFSSPAVVMLKHGMVLLVLSDCCRPALLQGELLAAVRSGSRRCRARPAAFPK